MDTLRSGNYRLRVCSEGSGIPALVIGSALFYPRIFSRHLREHLRLVFADHRGFAEALAPPQPGDFSLDVLLDDMERARIHAGLPRVAVIGHSGHGYLALEYAKKYPQHVSHVVMIGTGPDQSPASHAAADAALANHGGAERHALLSAATQDLGAAVAAAPQRGFATLCLAMGARSWHNPHFDAKHLWEGVTCNMAMFNEVWGQTFRDIDVTVGAEHATMPIWLAMGRHDYVVAPTQTWDLPRRAFANLRMTVFERSGHTPPLEEPAAFDAELLAWLRTV